jgi:hypothetical protein
MSASTHSQLFKAISIKEENEEQVLSMLENASRELINLPSSSPYEAETMLMWAVWRMKERVIEKLLDMGARVHPNDQNDQNVATFWDRDRVEREPEKAKRIVRMLHKAGAYLDFDVPHMTLSIVSVHSNPGDTLYELFKELGYLN